MKVMGALRGDFLLVLLENGRDSRLVLSLPSRSKGEVHLDLSRPGYVQADRGNEKILEIVPI